MTNLKIPVLSNVIKIPKTRQKVQQPTTLQFVHIQDYFEKTISVSNVKWDNAKIQALFDKTFNIVLEQNPIINELNYQKPKLNFDSINIDDIEDKTAVASYTFLTNEINIINPDYFNQDLYLLKYFSENNEPVDIKILPQKLSEDKKAKSENLRTEKTKLTPKEKELYLSSLFAHELRHSIMDNIVASTKNCNKNLMENINSYKKAMEDLLVLTKNLLDSTEDEKEKAKLAQDIEKINQDMKKCAFSLNYKPKKLFDENMTVNFSIIPGDNRYLSVKKHFADVDKEKTPYDMRPSEIDAYHYQGEFIITQAPEVFSSEIRKEVIDDIAVNTFLHANSQSLFEAA